MRDKIEKLAKSHTIPNDEKLEKRLDSLNHMARFYENKAETGDEKSRRMFKSFVESIMYAITVIRMYRSLTKSINKLAEEAENETRTSSKS